MSSAKFKKRGRRKQSTKMMIVSVAGVLIVIAGIFLFSITYVVLGEYEGMGKSIKLQKNPYSASKFVTKNGFRSYEDANYTSVCGMDVSQFQGEIDWEKVAASGIQFVMIRLGYSGSETGKIHMDARYRTNIRQAKDAGLEVGVYFFSQAINTEEAVREAKYVIRHTRSHHVTYPIAYDMEYMPGDRISELTPIERTEIADAFCSIIRQNGHTAMVYGNPSWMHHAIEPTYLTKNEIWLAHYAKKTDYENRFMMWQYTDSGKVDGIKGHVDLDICMVPK